MSAKRLNRNNLRRKRLLLDSNLTILLLVGAVRVDLIKPHKRLSSYDEVDFRILRSCVDRSSGVILCPNIATETSNLIRQGNKQDSKFAEKLKRYAEQATEVYFESSKAVRDASYPKLGLTDSAILGVLESQRNVSLLTADLLLYEIASKRRFSAQNFNHLRNQRPDFQ